MERRLKILFRSVNYKARRPGKNWDIHVHSGFYEALAEIADVKFSGQNFDRGSSVLKNIIRRHYGDSKPDVVIMYTIDGARVDASDDIDVFKVLIVHDKSREPQYINDYIKRWTKVDLIFSKYYRPEIAKVTNLPYEYLPHSIDPSLFTDYGLAKEYDVVIVGSGYQGTYSDRLEIHQNLLSEKMKNKYRYFAGGGIGRVAFLSPIETSQTYNKSKTAYSCPSSRNFLLARYFEIPASRSLLLCRDTPGLDLAFKKDKHYIEFTSIEDYFEKLNWFLEHDKEREEISTAAYNYCMQYHTNKIRAQEFVNTLLKYI